MDNRHRHSLMFAKKAFVVRFALPLFVLVAFGCGSQDLAPEKLEKIPLKEMYATVPHDGMKRLSLADELPFDQLNLERFHKLEPQASNIFLTKAAGLKGIDGVAYAGISFRAYPEVPLQKTRDHDSQIWLIVFFGFAPSNPREWTLDAVEYSRSKISVTYTVVAEDVKRPGEFEPYFVFVPFKELRTGEYELELRESASKEVTFMRRVQVIPTEP